MQNKGTSSFRSNTLLITKQDPINGLKMWDDFNVTKVKGQITECY